MSLRSMVTTALIAAAISTFGSASWANTIEKPTFTRDVAPILHGSCIACHSPNQGAPMSLRTYNEVRPWAKSILKNVQERTMPPWHASPKHGSFSNDRSLSEQDIDTIVNWVKAGAPRGNPKDAPKDIEWPTNVGWTIGEPDLILSMPEPYFVPDDVVDETKYFAATLTEEELPADRWIKAVEFKPGSEVVHHIIARPFGGIAPGNKALVYRDGYSAKVSKGARVVWNMHYHKEAGPGTGMWDQSSVGVKFYPEGYVPEHVLSTVPLGPMDFVIPAGEPDYAASAWHTFQKDSLINSMMPHMHLRGTKVLYQLFYPDGKEETLLSVPDYDFNWQTSYRFVEPKQVPAGTKVKLTGWWDNSEKNPFNPDPSKTITWGEATDEEMLFGWISYTHVDEDASGQHGIVRQSSDD